MRVTGKEQPNMERPLRRKMTAGERENHLIDKTIQVLAGSNYHTATTAKIAEEAGVSEAVIYQRFESKKDLFLAALTRIEDNLLEEWSEAISGARDPREALLALFAYHYTHMRSKKSEIKILFQAIYEVDEPEIKDNLRKHFEEVADLVSRTIREGVEQGILREDLDIALTAWLVISLGISADFLGLLGLDEELERERLLNNFGIFLDFLTGDRPGPGGAANRSSRADNS